MFTLTELEKRLKNAREILRARDLAKVGLTVEDRKDTAWRAKAISSGGEPYQVELRIDLTGTCDCMAWHTSATRRFCKHLAALAILWLESSGESADLDGSVRALFGDQPDLKQVVEQLSESEVRKLLWEAAAMDDNLKQRLLNGAWKSSHA